MVHTTVSFAWADTFRFGLRRLSIGMAGYSNAAMGTRRYPADLAANEWIAWIQGI